MEAADNDNTCFITQTVDVVGPEAHRGICAQASGEAPAVAGTHQGVQHRQGDHSQPRKAVKEVLHYN